MTRPEEHAYSSHISYCRALEAYCDKIEAELAELGVQCSDHPDAPHGFDRTSSHSLGRYVCVCEGWVP